ncbi:hypothetical protein OH77DRAFT_565274 [Trametes cingulata]|nr:hypothetical protein OH77DRAFT_565274 [Trametes cingulata]
MPLKHSQPEEKSPRLDSMSHTILPRKLSRNDMVSESAHDDTSGGRPPQPQAVPSGGGHPSSKQSSPIVPALVAVALICFASILVWWVVARIRRSWRGAPGDSAGAQEGEKKPVLSDIELGLPIVEEPFARWDKLSPISVEFTSDDDKKRWQYLSVFSDDDTSSLSTSSSAHLPKSRPISFSLFSRASSPATTITPDHKPLDLRVTLVIAMPSQHRGSQTSGEICLGVAQPPVL